ncbi:MAG: hypothetical protein HDT47_06600 [Ruminococcaceae bacterium]|nr:hypothetical protein [Oscillospiraceae bacterium]
MNIKKIIAGTAASALAVSAMAVAASAGTVTSSIPYSADDGNGNYQVFLSGDAVGGDLYNLDPSQIASYDVTLSWEAGEEDWIGGACIVQYESGGWWTQIGDYSNDGENRTWGNLQSGDTFNVVLPEAIPADEQSVILTFQNYSDGIAVNVDKIVLKDASGNAILTLPAEAAAPAATEATEAATEAQAPAAAGDTSAPAATTDKNNADTGVEGVAAVAGIAIVAAGAVVVAKKRK